MDVKTLWMESEEKQIAVNEVAFKILTILHENNCTVDEAHLIFDYTKEIIKSTSKVSVP